MRVDLHMHTTASDGQLDPAGLVDAVNAAGIRVFSVTDHDTVDGLPAVEARARDLHLTLVPGIELSAYWKKVEWHILGYYLDRTDRPLLAFLRGTREARRTRLQGMVDRLWTMGMPVNPQEVMALARDGNVGRPHLARVLVQRGFVGSTDEAFDRYLGAGKSAYVPRPDVSVPDAIRVVHEAGGLASLAHPGLHARDEAISELAAAGLDALEVYHANHSPGLTAHYRKLAKRLGLLVTGGSDFHGVLGCDHGSAPGTPCLPEPDFLRLQGAATTRRAAARG